MTERFRPPTAAERARIADGADVGRVGKVGEVGRQVTRAEALRISRQILERAEQERRDRDIELIEELEQLANLGWQLACEQAEEEGEVTDEAIPTDCWECRFAKERRRWGRTVVDVWCCWEPTGTRKIWAVPHITKFVVDQRPEHIKPPEWCPLKKQKEVQP